MPLDDFLDEVMQLAGDEPDGKEIQVERVKFLRYGEARGDYDKVVAALNACDPHGKYRRHLVLCVCPAAAKR